MKAKKTAKNVQYGVPVGNAWMVKSANSAKFSLITDNKRDAVAFAKEIASKLFLQDLAATVSGSKIPFSIVDCYINPT